jgi:hypothetical protein
LVGVFARRSLAIRQLVNSCGFALWVLAGSLAKPSLLSGFFGYLRSLACGFLYSRAI